MKKQKQYKCFYCGEYVDAEAAVCLAKEGTKTKKHKDGTSEIVLHITRKYFHKSCKDTDDHFKLYKKNTEDFLLKLYGAIVLPASLVIAHNNIAKLPNSSYEVINGAYRLAEQNIQWWINNKDFDNITGKMFYGCKIMESRLNEAYEETKKKNKHETMMARVMEHKIATESGSSKNNNASIIKSSNDEMDISSML